MWVIQSRTNHTSLHHASKIWNTHHPPWTLKKIHFHCRPLPLLLMRKINSIMWDIVCLKSRLRWRWFIEAIVNQTQLSDRNTPNESSIIIGINRLHEDWIMNYFTVALPVRKKPVQIKKTNVLWCCIKYALFQQKIDLIFMP